MFTKDSRYANTPTSPARDSEGREVTAVQLRHLPDVDGGEITVNASDQLDVIADQCYGNATQFWRVADANSELDVRDLLRPVGRGLTVPGR